MLGSDYTDYSCCELKKETGLFCDIFDQGFNHSRRIMLQALPPTSKQGQERFQNESACGVETRLAC